MAPPARIDVVTIFPRYLDPLELSLVGRARRAGLLDVHVHDLRDWAEDVHRTVDDTPAGGGAGMVMRPDVWGRAIDQLVDPVAGTVLVVPTPSGAPLTQAGAEALATDLGAGRRLLVACGRYEGIDARVAEHYAGRPGVRVEEVSIGDYVLAGGEAAALVLVEAVTRLLPGVLGNPDSLAEESHGASRLLEAPVYTRPLDWRGHEVPSVLRSGHHERIARWRREEALARTGHRRPDLLVDVEVAALDRRDLRRLAGMGWAVVGGRLRRFRVRRAGPGDVGPVADLAAETFPLACPPGSDPGDMAAFVAENLGPEAVTRYVTDPGRWSLLVAETVASDDSGRRDLLGYTLAVLPREPGEGPADPDVARVVDVRPVAELSKLYVRADQHGGGLAHALLAAAHADLAGRLVGGAAGGVDGAAGGKPVAGVWLGTNGRNHRARRFYAHAGYVQVGERVFVVGRERHADVVLLRGLTPADLAPAPEVADPVPAPGGAAAHGAAPR